MESNQMNIFLLGCSNVGKTSIIGALHSDKFNPCEQTTLYYGEVDMEFPAKEENIKARIFDTAGQDKFENIVFSIFHSNPPSIICFVFDYSNKESFLNLDHYFNSMDDHVQEASYYPIIIGNKIDLNDYKVNNEEALHYSNTKKCRLFNTSAKTGDGIDELRFHIGEQLSLLRDESKNKKIVSISLQNVTTNERSCC